jgi:SAM-dependent MidA family methyltransferase
MGNMTTNPLQQLIIERIQREGPIPFAEYMRMALYEPGYGYYVTGAAKMGWEGDYFTSTDVSTLFANCIGRQLYAMWEKLKRPPKFLIVEEGAGRGHLAEGVQAWAQREAPDFLAVLDYRVEDIRSGQDVLGDTLFSSPSLPQGTREGYPYHARAGWVASSYGRGTPRGYPGGEDGGTMAAPNPAVNPLNEDGVGTEPPHPSVILSNELIDAFPVHIVEIREGQLYEVYVDEQDGRLYEVLSEPSMPEVAGYLDTFKVPWQSFGDGWRAEINLDALRWIERTAQLVRKGFILTIDYGDKARDLYTRYQRRGTLTCYFQHQVSERPLARPGAQDITAHVNFTALMHEARRQGLRVSKFTTQREWLESLGIREELEQHRLQEFAEADTARATDRGQVALLKWHDLRQRAAVLTDPYGMGNFKVLILRR